MIFFQKNMNMFFPRKIVNDMDWDHILDVSKIRKKNGI